jgi:hypothetical protein
MIGLFLIQTVLWALAIYGITQIITEATIFEWLRNRLTPYKFFGKLVTCFLCASVWISFFLSAWVFSPSAVLWSDLYMIESTFIDGMIGSTIVWFLHVYENKLS